MKMARHTNLPLFMARRMARPQAGRRPAVTERIAVLSVALSIGAMLLTMAVMTGFKREITRKMTGIAAHIVVTDLGDLNAPGSVPLRRTPDVERMIASCAGFRSMAPYAVCGGIVRTDDEVEGVLLRGIGPEYDTSAFAEWLTEGALPRVDSARTKDLLLSGVLARQLRVGVGDRIEMLFTGDGQTPRRDRFRISGIYSSGMEEMDRAVALTDLRNVQRIAGWDEDQISGYEIRLDDAARADEEAERLDRAFLYDETGRTAGLTAASLYQRYPNVFDWLRAHDVNAAVIFTIMLLVAFFTMAAALLVLVLERTRTIGLLKTLGMPSPMLRQLFRYRAAAIALRGMAWGNGLTLGLCLAQRWGHIVRLPAEMYLLSEVPIAFGWWWVAVDAGFLAAIFLLLAVPARIIASIGPAEAVRYE